MAVAMKQDLVEEARRVGPILRENAERSDREGRLTAESVEAIRSAGFFRMYVPRDFGGLETEPMTHARVQEELATHDPAAAWALQSTPASALWISRLPDDGAEEIYAGGADQVIACAFSPPVEAVKVRGGFKLTGQRPFASNVSEASWTWLTALIDDGVMIGAFFPSDEAKIVPTWDTLGMRGTDSNDVAVDDLFIPKRRTFRIGMDNACGAHFQSPLYRVAAYLGIASYGPPVALGMARAAIDDVIELAQGKTPFSSATTLRERASAQGKVGRAEGLVRSARAYLHDRIADGWERTLAGDELTLEQKAELLLACTHCVDACAKAVELVYTAAGTSAIYKRSRLERLFRDSQVLRQHGFMNESRFETVGQVWFGLPPDMGFVAL